jgi:hypothetical protein
MSRTRTLERSSFALLKAGLVKSKHITNAPRKIDQYESAMLKA